MRVRFEAGADVVGFIGSELQSQGSVCALTKKAGIAGGQTRIINEGVDTEGVDN